MSCFKRCWETRLKSISDSREFRKWNAEVYTARPFRWWCKRRGNTQLCANLRELSFIYLFCTFSAWQGNSILLTMYESKRNPPSIFTDGSFLEPLFCSLIKQHFKGFKNKIGRELGKLCVFKKEAVNIFNSVRSDAFISAVVPENINCCFRGNTWFRKIAISFSLYGGAKRNSPSGERKEGVPSDLWLKESGHIEGLCSWRNGEEEKEKKDSSVLSYSGHEPRLALMAEADSQLAQLLLWQNGKQSDHIPHLPRPSILQRVRVSAALMEWMVVFLRRGQINKKESEKKKKMKAKRAQQNWCKRREKRFGRFPVSFRPLIQPSISRQLSTDQPSLAPWGSILTKD